MKIYTEITEIAVICILIAIVSIITYSVLKVLIRGMKSIITGTPQLTPQEKRKYISYICLVSLIAGWTVYRHYYLKPITCDRNEVLNIAMDFAEKAGYEIDMVGCRVRIGTGFLSGPLENVVDYYLTPREQLRRKRSYASLRCENRKKNRRLDFEINCIEEKGVRSFMTSSIEKKDKTESLLSTNKEIINRNLRDHAESLLSAGIVNSDDLIVSSTSDKHGEHFEFERSDKNTGKTDCIYVTTDYKGRLIHYRLSHNQRCIR